MESKEMELFVAPFPTGSTSPITRGIAAGSSTPTTPLYLNLSRDLKEFDVVFGKDEGFFHRRKETDEVLPAVAHDEYQHITVPPTQEAPQDQVREVTGTSRLDQLYKPYFQPHELYLAALVASISQENAQATQHVTEGTALMASTRQENAQVPPSVSEGKVPELGVVGMGAGGEPEFGTELADHKAGKAK